MQLRFWFSALALAAIHFAALIFFGFGGWHDPRCSYVANILMFPLGVVYAAFWSVGIEISNSLIFIGNPLFVGCLISYAVFRQSQQLR